MEKSQPVYFTNLRVSDKSIQRRLRKITNNEVMKEIYTHIESARPTVGLRSYVPQKSGNLIRSAFITKYGIRWTAKYAHYQYAGIVYGPNYLVKDKETGEYKWRTPKGATKYPTGRHLYHDRTKSRNASKLWDQRFVAHNREWIARETEKILRKHAKKLHFRFK